MTQLAEATRAVLALIADQGPLSIADMLGMDEIEPILADQSATVRGRVLTLSTAGYLSNFKPRSDKPVEYSVTKAGQRVLRVSMCGGGSVAGPRPAPSGQYVGTELRPFTARPGAMDAFTKPSLVNGQEQPRVAPKIISSQPEPRV